MFSLYILLRVRLSILKEEFIVISRFSTCQAYGNRMKLARHVGAAENDQRIAILNDSICTVTVVNRMILVISKTYVMVNIKNYIMLYTVAMNAEFGILLDPS